MTTSSKQYQNLTNFREIKESDIDDVIAAIKNEKWFMTKPKLEIIYREGLAKFYVIEDVHDGKILGIANVTNTRDTEAMLGNVIIRPEIRGQGLGKYLMRKVLSLHEDIILTWFSTSHAFYENLGCIACGDQYGLGVYIDMDREKVNLYCQENTVQDEVKVIPFSEVRMDELVQYDREARGYDNQRVLSLLIRTEENFLMAVRGVDERIVGYTAIQCEDFGSLLLNGFYADDDKIAALLLRESLAMNPGWEKVRFMTLYSRQFLLQFGTPSMTLKVTRFTSGCTPAMIPEKKLYCINQSDLTY